MGTGWTPPAFLLRDPAWLGAAATAWSPILGAGEREGPPGANDLVAGNRAIVADLIRAVETDTRPRADARGARTAVEMVLACYAAHLRQGAVTLLLADRDAHPLIGPPRPGP
jgi:hypothetical protein